MTDRVHQLVTPLGLPVMTECGQRDGELGPEGLTHYTTFNGRVTCPECLRAMEQPGQLALDLGAA